MKDESKLLKKQLKEKAAMEMEYARFKNMCIYEEQAYGEGVQIIGGIDEAGRGPLAGPVVAACVILPREVFIKDLNDSKKLTPAKRDLLYDEIREKALSIGIGTADEKCIDEINILNATKKAMQMAIEAIKPVPELLLIDAVKLENVSIRQIPIIKGDALSISIAAASIIAKVTRDRLITEIDEQYPVYGFKKHKGYGTEDHINAIKKYGICPIHRISFTKNFM
jgi:Ribonuclease HII